MKKSVKAALWSAFAFPGAGHLALRQYLRGLLLLAVTVGAATYLVDDILSRGLVDKVNDVAYKIMSGAVEPDPDKIDAMLDLGPDPIGEQIASWLIVVCWVGGIVDSFRIGRRQDAEDVQAKQAAKP